MVSETDLLQTYFPSFEACIREGRARSIMCSYSTVNGKQGCEQPVLQSVLRDEWKFDGFVTADDGGERSNRQTSSSSALPRMPPAHRIC